MLEVEAKVELLAPGALRDWLRAAGAVAEPVEEHEDLFFQHPSKDLAANDEAFRFRTINGRMFLTYKGPKRGTDVKVREEHEVEVQQDPCAMLAGLGFTPAATLRKRREPWTLEDVHVTIDTIDGLGTFAEVEVLADDEAQATTMVESVLKGLGLEGTTRHNRSYLEMALDVGAAAAQSE